MKIVHKICCGVDVHKREIVATIAFTDSQNITTYKRKNFPTFTHSLYAFADWLLANNCKLVCMESTGKYFIPVYRILEEKGIKPYVAHPKFLRAIPGKKTDNKDSKWIADLFKHDLVPMSFIPSKDLFELRDLCRYSTKLTNIRCGEKNRIQNSLTVSNIMLSSVVSDTFGKSSSAIIKYVLDHPEEKDIDFTKFLHKRLLPKADEIKLAMDGRFSPEQASKTKIAFKHFDYINDCLEQLDMTISLLAKKYSKEIDLISTAPGFTEQSATRVISEIGSDMKVFLSAKHLCSWAGLTPQNNESAGKKKSVRISRAGTYLKPLLVQCAYAAVKDQSCPYFAYKFQNISRRRGKKRAIIAIARMLLTSIYHILSDNTSFNITMYDEYYRKATTRFSNIKLSKLMEIAQLNGYSLVDINSGEVLGLSG